jgi:starch synthase
MKVLLTAAEIYPLAKTGGLGDVVSALPKALHEAKADVRLLMPAYRGAAAMAEAKPAASLGDFHGFGETVILEGRMPATDLKVWLIDSPGLYDRDGGPYADATGADWVDNDVRFALLAWAAARLSQAESPLGWTPDILHVHDWQTALAPAYLRAWGGPAPGVVFTIHNIAFQGNFPSDLVPRIGLPWSFFTMDGFEYWGQLSYLKAGLVYADKLTTVSPTYAHEIQTPALGFGMQGLLTHRADDLSGILNGADYGVWDPAQDKHLAAPYPATDFVRGKAANKAALQAQLGLTANPDAPLLVVISRLSDQKGMDLLLGVMPMLIEEGAQVAILGTGDRWLEDAFQAVSVQHPQQVAVRIGYVEELAHRLQAGGDMLLMPSRFEPCGLSQMYAQRYATLPIVHSTGGLADTVVNASYDTLLTGAATGFQFDQPTASAFQWCIERAIALYRHPDQWRRIQARAIQQDFGWHRSAASYLDLYRALRPGSAPAKAKGKRATAVEA